VHKPPLGSKVAAKYCLLDGPVRATDLLEATARECDMNRFIPGAMAERLCVIHKYLFGERVLASIFAHSNVVESR
jgi:hypothetical protein